MFKKKDPVTVKNALGHSSIIATMVYVHLVGSDVEKALSDRNGAFGLVLPGMYNHAKYSRLIWQVKRSKVFNYIQGI